MSQLELELELRRTSFLRCNLPCNRFVSVQTGLKRESDYKRNKTQAGAKTVAPAVELLPCESHATANISLFSSLTKLPTAALNNKIISS